MFRRRPDLSWPLIALLAGLFILSLRMPRQWERIARDSRLELPSRAAVESDIPATAPIAPASDFVDPTAYSAIEPAAAVGSNAEFVASSEVKSPSADVVPVAASAVVVQNHLPASSAPAKEVEVAVAAERSIPTPRSEPFEPVDATRSDSDEVHVLRDASITPDSHSADAAENVISSNRSIGRSLAPEPEIAAAQTKTDGSGSTTIQGPLCGNGRATSSSGRARSDFRTSRGTRSRGQWRRMLFPQASPAAIEPRRRTCAAVNFLPPHCRRRLPSRRRTGPSHRQ